MKWYKYVGRGAGFVFGLAVMLALLSVVFCREDGLYVYDALNVDIKTNDILEEPANSLDIIFIGDSECYASISPKDLSSKFGYNSYVCATAAQRICDTYAILCANFKTQSPQLVVLETNCLYRSLKSEGADSDVVLNALTERAPVFAYHSRWKSFARQLMPKSRGEERRKKKGFVMRDDIVPYKGGEYMKKTKKIKEIDEDILSYLDQIKALCEENGAQLLLFSVSAPKNWNYQKHNGVNAWAKEHAVSYLDLNLEKNLAIDWKKDTKDGGDHMNVKGAKKVTVYMGQYFKDHYDIKAREEQ